MTGRRSDGFHELVSVFQAVSLHDELDLQPASDLHLEVQPPLGPSDANNLVLQAARLLRASVASSPGARMTLRKHIPVAAGLGGGSADAAAALVGLRRLWQTPNLTLMALAARLGSDVPFFLGTATALVGGRGEQVTALAALAPRHLVLFRPPVPLATPAVFAELTAREWTDGRQTRRLATRLAAGESWTDQDLINTMQGAAERCCPPLRALRLALTAQGLRPHLSGSGPTMFVFAGSGREARRIAALARRLNAEAWPCRTRRSRPVQVRPAATPTAGGPQSSNRA